MLERLTGQARQVLLEAQADASRNGWLGTEHLLLALAGPEGGAAAAVLAAEGLHPDDLRARVGGRLRSGTSDDAAALGTLGIDLDAVRARVEQVFGPGALDRAARPGPTGPRCRRRLRRARARHGGATGVPLTPRAKRVMELALREALALRHPSIGTEHLLLGLLREGQGLAALVLSDAGVPFARLRARTLAALNAAA